ncbi:hypothetical protein COE98_16565 [Bacillus wiedmannii]|uniref:hypothetical protein n=1 Tax=Bacillus wiedmannii TaxID=1890302 RepID=UPI000BFB12B9|nr:hypothetical protein [Bacillus wiedmannii]PHB90220.1 hypothetical protein COE98_16565 [Bacillus wiedmannii]
MDTVILNEILQQFKDRMRLGDDEDDNLRRILFASNEALIKVCGSYDIAKDETFKELVFERSRYVYNDALEYFTKNFLTEINSFGIAKALEEIKLDGD